MLFPCPRQEAGAGPGRRARPGAPREAGPALHDPRRCAPRHPPVGPLRVLRRLPRGELQPRQDIDLRAFSIGGRATPLRGSDLPPPQRCGQDSLLPAAASGEPGRLSVHLYQTPKLRGALKRALPPRWNEIVGVSHVKAIVTDDDVVMTGANLSETYFTVRQDRYMRFRAAPGLADEVAALVGALGACSRLYKKASPEVHACGTFAPHGSHRFERLRSLLVRPSSAGCSYELKARERFSFVDGVPHPEQCATRPCDPHTPLCRPCRATVFFVAFPSRMKAKNPPRRRPSAFRAHFASTVGSLFRPYHQPEVEEAEEAAATTRGGDPSSPGARFEFPEDVAVVMPAVQAGSLGVHQVWSRRGETPERASASFYSA